MRNEMKFILVAVSAVLLMGAADGSWLHRVSPKDHERVNPLTLNDQSAEHAASGGAQVYSNECAKCHGRDGMGRGARPAIISDRIAHASDGDLFWIVTNGNAWKGMPPWQQLPEKERWQVVAYMRSLNNNNAAEPVATDPSLKKP